MFSSWFRKKNVKEMMGKKALLGQTSCLGPWSLAPKRSINLDHSDLQSSCLSFPVSNFSTHLTPPAVRQGSLTSNTFLCNLSWQGENISIKMSQPRQTGLVLDNLSDWVFAQLCPHFIFGVILAFFFSFNLPNSCSFFSPRWIFYQVVGLKWTCCLKLLVIFHRIYLPGGQLLPL